MRRFLIWLIFVVMVCFARTSEARKLALLVGVDEYDDVPSLKCCVNDMKTLKEALLKVGFEEDDIQVLVTNGASRDFPSKKKIERRIGEILSQAQPSDMIFFAFSGHGAQDGQNVYFCPPDVEVDDLDGTCVSITKVMDDLAKCEAKFKWMVVDACRNDPTRSAKGIGGRSLQTVPAPPAGIALFQSCAAGEESWEDQESGNGYFTKNFAAALSGTADANHDGKLTLMEVCSWTTAQTKEQVKASQNKSQKPYFSGSFSDFTLTEDLNVPKAKALAIQAREKIEKGEYEEGIRLFDKAIKLYPKFNSWKRERDYALKLLNQKGTAPKIDYSNLVVPDDIRTLEKAYAKVKDGGTITIKPGKYELSKPLIVNRNVTFRGDSENPESVVIHCSDVTFGINTGSPSFQNLTVISSAERLGSFYIVGGTPKLFRCVIISTEQSGVYVEGKGANPSLELCVVKDCGKFGVYVCKEGGGEFRDCVIYGNAYSGINVKESGNPVVTGCKILAGKKVGVFISEKGLGEFSDCEIYGNAKSGIRIQESGNPTFTKCKIHHQKEDGVCVTMKGRGEFRNCEIYGNASLGIEVMTSGNPTFTGCKIHDGKSAGVLVFRAGRGEFRDCEIYRNERMGILVSELGNPFITGCRIHDGKGVGIGIGPQGMGTFINNVLSKNYYEGKLSNWGIVPNAGELNGSGNTPPMPQNESRIPNSAFPPERFNDAF